jgi:predicted acetyltransferase
MLALRKVIKSDAEAFQKAYRATQVSDPTFARGFSMGMAFREYLARLDEDEQGLRLPESFVPTTLYWGFIGSELVGRRMLRHRLNDRLRQTGGNIGLHRRARISAAWDSDRNAPARLAAREGTRARSRSHHL